MILGGQLPSAASPNARALVELGEEGSARELSFAALERHVALLAAALCQHMGSCRCAIGVLSPRSAEAVAAMLAIWRAGAVYLPLDGPCRRLAACAPTPSRTNHCVKPRQQQEQQQQPGSV